MTEKETFLPCNKDYTGRAICLLRNKISSISEILLIKADFTIYLEKSVENIRGVMYSYCSNILEM